MKNVKPFANDWYEVVLCFITLSKTFNLSYMIYLSFFYNAFNLEHLYELIDNFLICASCNIIILQQENKNLVF